MLVDPLLVTSGDLTQVQEVQVGAVNSGNQVGEAEVEGRSEVVWDLVIRLIVLWSQGSNIIIIDVKMLWNHHAQAYATRPELTQP